MERFQAPGPAAPRAGRLDGVDFWRGVVLCCIFINHVPGNVFENVTPRNFGFSDSAEAFVFISGLAIALAYGRRFARDPGSVVLAMRRRAVKLYATHIGLSLAGLAIFAFGANLLPAAGLMDVHGRDLVVEDPLSAVVGLVSMGHQFGYFNILPMYVILVALVPLLLWLQRAGTGLMLGASFALYALAAGCGLNIPTWPMRGTWFLDPFAWQFLMALGLAAGASLAGPARPARPWALALSATVVAAGMVCTTDVFGRVPGLYDALRGPLDLDKTTLGPGRLVHFVCLAYLVANSGITGVMRRLPVFGPLRLMGCHGLPVFALLSLLAAAGQVIGAGLGHSLAVDTAVIGVGLAAMWGAARLLEAPAAARHPLVQANGGR